MHSLYSRVVSYPTQTYTVEILHLHFTFQQQFKGCFLVKTRKNLTTSPLPLFNLLTRLVYLTSTSPRIREIMTMDGGLMALLPQPSSWFRTVQTHSLTFLVHPTSNCASDDTSSFSNIGAPRSRCWCD